MMFLPADYVVHVFGGVRELARALDVNPSCVCRWQKRRANGEIGRIPSGDMPTILRLAHERGLDCQADDLINGRDLPGLAPTGRRDTQPRRYRP